MGASGGAFYLWIVVWSLLGLALAVTGGIVAARVLSNRRRDQIPASAPGLEEAQASLRQRYARGEISREDFLQERVELENW